MVPMTLISFIVDRPPACLGVAMTPMCTTVSTPASPMTLAITGLRMSARTNSVPGIGASGATTSTPITREIDGSSASTRRHAAAEVPRHARDQHGASHETPLNRTAGRGGYFLLRRWTRVRRSNLRCFFFAIRLRRFLTTEPIKNPYLVEDCRWTSPYRRPELPGRRQGWWGQAVSTKESRR